MNEETLFEQARSRPAAERAAFLDQACADQPDLRSAVEALLAAHEMSGNILDRTGAETLAFGPGQSHPDATLDHTPGPDPASAAATATADYGAMSEPGIVITGRYTLQQKLGEGGMGEVWVAKQTEPVKRRVALKLIKTGMDSRSVLARFDQERQALAVMDHPNIAKVLDGGLTPTGQPFFVMELVNGLPLNKFCDEAKLTPRDRLELFVPICQAVQHAHQKGIVHRDLKPANILVTIIDGKPVPKIIDFGVAKAIAGKLTDESMDTQFGAVIGTLEYMSPEQAGFSSVDIDTRSDIYSLGVILYELLTGLRPIDARRLRNAAITEMIRIIQEEEPSKPSTRLSTDESLPSLAALRQTEPRKLMAILRGELDWVVMKCLEKQRERRYETANALARDIQRYLADEAVEARPPTAGYRLSKFLRRNRGPVLAAGLVLLALVGGIIGTTYGLIRADRALANEATQRGIAQANEAKAVAAAEAERKAKEREAQQRTRAEKARDRTRQALDAMTSSVTGDSLTTQKQISAEQKKFLTEVLTYYKEFASEKADDEPSPARTAIAAFRVGSIEYRLGRTAEAVAANRQAIEGFSRLVAQFPAVPEYRKYLADSQNNVGLLLTGMEKGPEAEEHSRRALATIDKLVAEFPAVPFYRNLLGKAHNNLGILLKGKGKAPEAEKQYRKALAIQEKLVAEFPAVPEFRMSLGQSHNSLGVLLAGIGMRPEALEEFRKALAIQEKLVTDFPAVSDYRLVLCRSHNNLGLLHALLKQWPEAEQQYRKAVAIQEMVIAEFPAVPEYRKSLALVHNNLGHVLTSLGKGPEAEEQFRTSLPIQEKLVADFPAVPEHRKLLGDGHNNLGILLAGLGKQPEAEGQYRKALAIQEKLVADFPTVPRYQVALGGCYCNLAILISKNGRPGESLEWFNKAIPTLSAVYEQDHRLVEARECLRNSHEYRARALDRLRKFTDAMNDWEKAIELSPKHEQPPRRIGHAQSRLQAGQVAEAVAEVDTLLNRTVEPAVQWYNYACFYAAASGKSTDRKQEYADRSMKMLQEAVDAGWSDSAHMASDTDLDSIRGRDDFKKLIEELTKKSPAEPAPKPGTKRE